MAEMKSSPWNVFPADANTGGPLKKGLTYIDSIVFSNYLDPEHKVRLTDRWGRDVFDTRGSTDGSPVMFTPNFLYVWDLTVAQLDSGNLNIYIR